MKVSENEKKLEELKLSITTSLETIKKERAEDREILIRIDERVKRLDGSSNSKQ